MTTAEQSPHFLKCIICHKVFKDPITLKCGHTFCAQCVEEPTTQQHDTDDTHSLKCPLCGQETRVPLTELSAKEGTDQLHTSLFITRLAKAYSSEEKGDEICGLCEDYGKKKAAVVWCSDCAYTMCINCLKVHRKLNTSHRTTDVTENEPRTVRPKCDKHSDSIVDLICEDCEEAVCHKCCILEHRTCKKVTPLDESTRRIDLLLDQYSRELESDLSDIKSHTEHCKTQSDKISANIENVKRSIDETSDELVAEIREQQKLLKEKVGWMTKEALHRLNEEVKSGELRLDDAYQRIGLAYEVQNSASPMDHFEIYKIFAVIRNSGNQWKSKDANAVENGAGVNFVSNKNTLLASLQKRRIGFLKVMSDKTDDKEQSKKIYDSGSADLYDMTILTFEGTKMVVVTDPIKKHIQSFYTKLDQEQNSTLRVNTPVYGITQLEPTKAATTLPKRKQILVVQVSPKLEKDCIIKTQLRYMGVTCLTPTTLAVSGEESGFIDIIDLSGTRLRSFGADIFSRQLYLCATLDSHVLVSDVQFTRAVCVNDEGEVQFQYDPMDKMILSSPRGVCQGVTGDIFLVDSSHHKVIQLDQNGQFLRHVLTFEDGISDPNCIYVDSDNVIYVSVDGRFIHVQDIED